MDVIDVFANWRGWALYAANRGATSAVGIEKSSERAERMGVDAKFTGFGSRFCRQQAVNTWARRERCVARGLLGWQGVRQGTPTASASPFGPFAAVRMSPSPMSSESPPGASKAEVQGHRQTLLSGGFCVKCSNMCCRMAMIARAFVWPGNPIAVGSLHVGGVGFEVMRRWHWGSIGCFLACLARRILGRCRPAMASLAFTVSMNISASTRELLKRFNRQPPRVARPSASELILV
jgi:hypothetical protein